MDYFNDFLEWQTSPFRVLRVAWFVVPRFADRWTHYAELNRVIFVDHQASGPVDQCVRRLCSSRCWYMPYTRGVGNEGRKGGTKEGI